MVEDDSFLELAKLCFKICQVLTVATKGRGANDLGGLSTEEVEDLGRCVTSLKTYYPTVLMRGTSTLRHIESGARERADPPRDRRGHNANFDGACIIKWRVELSRILDVFDVRRYYRISPILADHLPNAGYVGVTFDRYPE